MKDIIIRLEPEIHKRLKIYAAETETTIQEIVHDLVSSLLDSEDIMKQVGLKNL